MVIRISSPSGVGLDGGLGYVIKGEPGFNNPHSLLGIILLPAGTSIVLPVGYMNQPRGLLHIYL